MECGALCTQSSDTFHSAIKFERVDELKRRSETTVVDRAKRNRGSFGDRQDSGFYDEVPLHNENCQMKPETKLDNLPLEILDEILQKACLLMMFREVRPESDKFIIMTLASIDIYRFITITGKRFKKTMWRHLTAYYEKKRTESSKYLSILHTNRKYLVQAIQHDESYRLLWMLTPKVLTASQIDYIVGRFPHDADKTRELLFIARSFDDTQFIILIECLRKTSQSNVVELLEKGGVAVKVIVQNEKVLGFDLKSKEIELVEKLRELKDATIQRSSDTEKLIDTLTDAEMQIIHAVQKHGMVLWIWCQSRSALEKLRLMSESGSLLDLLSKLFTHLSTNGKLIPKAVIIHKDQFKKVAAGYRIGVKLTKTISLRKERKSVRAVTKLHNNIYVLCISNSYAPNSIYKYEDRSRFRFLQRFKLKNIIQPWDIASSPVGNCLYVTDCSINCIWKIKPKAKVRVTKWLDDVTSPWTLSVQKNGRILIVRRCQPLPQIEIYRTNGTVYSIIVLPVDIHYPYHAAQTSEGKFVIIHWKKQGLVTRSAWIPSISEVSEDGRNLRCGSQNEVVQQLNNPSHVFIDSADRVFVADSGNNRVVLLDSMLNWSGIVLSTTEEELEEEKPDSMRWPVRLFYDEQKKQLAVAGDFFGLNIYTVNQQETL